MQHVVCYIFVGLYREVLEGEQIYKIIHDKVKSGCSEKGDIYVKKIYEVKKSPVANFDEKHKKSDLKWHGTTEMSMNEIAKNGYKLGNKYHNMYGGGIYTADDAWKSAKYTGHNNKLILSKVALGKQKTVIKRDRNITDKKLRKQGYDSVISPGGHKLQGGVHLTEHVVYSVDKITPAFIVEFIQVPRKNGRIYKNQ